MKKSYQFDTTNISYPFTGTYKKFDNPIRSKVYDLKSEACYSSLFVLNKKCNKQTETLSSFIKIITQFFSFKESLHPNGIKVCTDEFTFINPNKI